MPGRPGVRSPRRSGHIPCSDKVLIANRGAIACRIQRTLRRLHVGAVAVYSEADRGSLHVRTADQAVLIGGASAADSYLRSDRILQAAIASGAQAIHPGYGFLSENAQFAEQCERAGIAFDWPDARRRSATSDAEAHWRVRWPQPAALPLLPGSDLLLDLPQALLAAQHIGYPVMLKSTAGGGGIGMRMCADEAESCAMPSTACAASPAVTFATPAYSTRSIRRACAGHIEVQLFGDGAGQVIALGERDCSMQRRNQKVIEETPAPGLGDRLRSELCAAAVRLGKAVRYRSAGTVEFIVDADRLAGDDSGGGGFYFLEVNSRLQVEHGVTEAVTGVDLVEWMIQACRRREAAPIWTAIATTPTGVSPSRAAVRRKIRRAPFVPRAACSPRYTLPIACGSIAGSTAAAKCRRSTIRCSPS